MPCRSTEASCLEIGARYGATLGAVAGVTGARGRRSPGRRRAGVRGDGDGVGGGAGAVAVVGAGGARAEPLEGPEAANLGGRDDLPGFGHRQDGTSVAGPGGDLDVSARDVV